MEAHILGILTLSFNIVLVGTKLIVEIVFIKSIFIWCGRYQYLLEIQIPYSHKDRESKQNINIT